MQINSINQTQQNFQARVSNRFVEAACNYYAKNSSTSDIGKFRKQLVKVETYGHPDTVIKYSKNKENGTHSLVLKNNTLATGEHLVICKKDKFRKLLEYFSHLTDGKIRFAEKRLTGEIK